MNTKTIKIEKEKDIKKCRKIDDVFYVAEMMGYDGNIMPRSFEGSVGLSCVICGEQTKIIGERAFANCKNLIRFDGFPEIIAKEAFSFCSRLKNFNFSNVANLSESSFAYSGLETIDIPSNIKNIPSNCFAGCLNLKSINLNEVEQIEDEAFQTSSLRYIKIQNPLETIGKKAFEGSMLLTDIFVERILPPKIFSSTFYGCPIRNIYFYSDVQVDFFIRDKNWSKYQDYFKVISPKDAKVLINNLRSL
jgi:hypothetical protein